MERILKFKNLNSNLLTKSPDRWVIFFFVLSLYFSVCVLFGYYFRIVLPLIYIFYVIVFYFFVLFVHQLFTLFKKLDIRDYSASTKLVLLALSFLFLYVAKIIFYYPDYSWDGQAYHLTTSVEIFKSKKIDIFPISLYSSTYPGLSETMQAIWMLASNIVGPPHNISQIIGFILLIASINGILNVLKVPTDSKVYILAYVSCMPVILLQLTTAYNDLFFSSLLVTSCYFAIKYVYSPGNKILYVACFGFSLGMAASTKFTGLWFLLFIGSLFHIFLYFNKVTRFITPFIFLVTSLTISHVWYLRNYLIFGNPMYPLTIKFGSFEIFKGSIGTPDEAFFDGFAGSVGISNDWIGVMRSVFIWPILNPVYDSRLGGFGLSWLCLICAFLPLILYVQISRKSISRYRLNNIYFIFFLGFFSSMFIVPAGWWPRYVIFFPIMAGSMIIYFTIRFRYAKFVLSGLLILTCIESTYYLSFNAGAGIGNHKYLSRDSLLGSSKSVYLTLTNSSRYSVYDKLAWDLKPLATGDYNVYFSGSDYRYFPLYGLQFQNTVSQAFDSNVDTRLLNLKNSKLPKSVEDLNERIKFDLGPSIFVSDDLYKVKELQLRNSSCIDLTQSGSRAYILKCI